MSDVDALLKLAYEIRSDLFDSSSSVSSIVRKYYTLLQLMNENDETILGELFGYTSQKVPKYRQMTFPADPLWGTDEIPYAIKDSIALIEKSKDTGRKFTIMVETVSLPRTFIIQARQMQHIIESVKNIILLNTNKKIIKMEYSDINYKIFEETKKYVDNKLSELDSSILNNLIKNYEQLKLVNDTDSASRISFSCRQIIQNFTDLIFDEYNKSDGIEKPDKSKTKNKVRYVLSSIKSESNRELIEAQIEYFNKFDEYIQKNVHPRNFTLSKEDANRSIIYTYLIMGDILKILENKIPEK